MRGYDRWKTRSPDDDRPPDEFEDQPEEEEEMNRTAEQWAHVKPDAFLTGSIVQARNVIEMAVQDIAELYAECDDWKQAAEVEAGLRREFLGRAEKAEAELVRLHAANEKKAVAGEAGAVTETKHLLRFPANALHLLASIEEAKAGNVVEFDEPWLVIGDRAAPDPTT